MAAVLHQMRQDVNASARQHPLRDPALTLASGEMLVVVLPGSNRILFDYGSNLWPQRKLSLFREQIVSHLRALLQGRCDKARAAPAAFLFRSSSVGCSDSRCDRMPTLVIGRAPARGLTAGIMSPNPYFQTFDAWTALAGEINRHVSTMAGNRTRRVMWRGKMELGELTNAPPDRTGAPERLAAATLTVLHPEQFDVADPSRDWWDGFTGKLWQTRKDLVTEAILRHVPPGDYSAGLERFRDASFVTPNEFANYAALLNLPGLTANGYSRNLNHAWVTESPVLLWRWQRNGRPGQGEPLYEEWYYPALRDNVTHIEVSAANAVEVASELLAPSAAAAEWRRQLGEASRSVHDELVCPCCIAQFYGETLSAIGEAQQLDEATPFSRTSLAVV